MKSMNNISLRLLALGAALCISAEALAYFTQGSPRLTKQQIEQGQKDAAAFKARREAELKAKQQQEAKAGKIPANNKSMVKPNAEDSSISANAAGNNLNGGNKKAIVSEEDAAEKAQLIKEFDDAISKKLEAYFKGDKNNGSVSFTGESNDESFKNVQTLINDITEKFKTVEKKYNKEKEDKEYIAVIKELIEKMQAALNTAKSNIVNF